MAGVDAKGRTVLTNGERSDEVTIDTRGALKVKLVSRGTAREGYGSAQLAAGVAAKGEVEIINGAVKVKVI